VSIKEAWVPVLSFFVFLSAVAPGFCLVLDRRGRLGGKVGSALRSLRTMRVVYWVDVSESSGAGSPGCPG